MVCRVTRRRIEPRRWQPPPAQRSEPTAELKVTQKLQTGGYGPEDARFDDQGRVLAGTKDGRILRFDLATGERTVLAETGGRPLGLRAVPDGSVLVCDHDRGLLRIGAGGDVEVLAEAAFASNVVQTADGTIWFTTSSSRWDVEHHVGDMFEHSCTGRLLRRDPDGRVTTVLTGLKFANGLVLTPDGSSLLFAETAGYRITRYWLTGERQGRTEPFTENLPGFPDNLSLGSDGLLWTALAAPRNALLDRLLPLPGVLRLLVWNLPPAVRPKATPIAWVLAFDLGGRLVHDLRTSDGTYGFVTSVDERDGTLVLGSLTEQDIALVRMDTRP
jgi:sugar lactone lactonase YvrE